MRKIFVLGLVLLLLAAASGCEKDNGSAVTSQPGQPSDDGGAGDSGTTTPAPSGNAAVDLNLEKVTWSTIHPETGQQVDLKVTVTNVGKEAVEGFDYNVRITKDGTEWKDDTKTYGDTFYPGNKTKIELSYTFTGEGKYAAEVYIDKDNKLEEKNRFNNVQISLDANVIKPTSTADLSGDSSDEDEEDTSDSGSSGSCTDTDDGKDEFTKGECDDGVTVFGISDYCMNSNTVKEYYCSDTDRCATENIACDDGCENGVCL